jgi:hypothetical protein
VVRPWYYRSQKSERKEDAAVLLKTKEELHDPTAEAILARLSDTARYPNEALAPYEEFSIGTQSYYFTPGGFLYRKDPGTKEVGGFFCGYLTDEVWHYRIDNGYSRFCFREQHSNPKPPS